VVKAGQMQLQQVGLWGRSERFGSSSKDARPAL